MGATDGGVDGRPCRCERQKKVHVSTFSYTTETLRYSESVHGPDAATVQSWSVAQRGNIVEVGYGGGSDFPQYAAHHADSSYLRLNFVACAMPFVASPGSTLHPRSLVCCFSPSWALSQVTAAGKPAAPRFRRTLVAALDDLDVAVEQYHRAAGEFVKGNPEPYKMMFSHREDVTLANPFGPVARGWKQVAETMERAASLYKDGEIIGFENVSKYLTTDLAYIVEVERFKAKIAGRGTSPVALRTTSILRCEDGIWKVMHRHADPITTVRPAESVIQT